MRLGSGATLGMAIVCTSRLTRSGQIPRQPACSLVRATRGRESNLDPYRLRQAALAGFGTICLSRSPCGLVKLRSPRRYDQNPMTRPAAAASFSATEVSDDAKSLILGWLERASDTHGVPEEWVPGATAHERAQLRVLGGLVAAHRRRSRGSLGWLSTVPEIARWLEDAPVPPDYAVEALADICEQGLEAVADIYASVVHGTGRRHLGTFFTPTAEASWMIRRWKEQFGSPRSVIDVGAGVGMFTFRAHEAWPDAQLVPVDINPVTLGLLAVGSAEASERIESVMSPQLADFAAWSQTSFADLAGPRLILGNPPYTRLQLIPREQRKTLLDAAAGLCGSRASLSALMLATSLTLLQAGDGLCLLLPAQWLESDYAEGLRAWLWSATDRLVELHLFDSRLFADAQVDAVCLLVGPAETTRQPLLASGFNNGSAGADALRLDRSTARPTNWRGLFDMPPQTPSVHDGRQLRDFASIRRGVASGANDFFTLSAREVAAWSLPTQILQPYVHRARDFPKGEAVSLEDLEALPETAKRFVLNVDLSTSETDSVGAYLAHGLERKVHESYLALARRLWFDLTPLPIPDVIISPTTRSRFRILENKAGATITNNLYGLSWLPDVEADVRSAILDWLRTEDGQQTLLLASRTHAGGLRKIELRALGDTRLPRGFGAE